MIDLELNTACRPDIRLVGEEKTPVIVLDDLLTTVAPLIAFAREESAFGPDSEFAYPGVRAPLPPGYAELLVPELAGLVSHIYNTPRGARHQLIHQVFSLITTQPDALAPLQRIPHTDTRHRYYFATVHYLDGDNHGGTGFFRHRPTGYERISEARFPGFVEAGNAHMESHGLPAQKYIDESDDHFELIAQVDHRPNRMIVYPGNLLHSGLIRPEADISDDPSHGRLTANLFLYFP